MASGILQDARFYMLLAPRHLFRRWPLSSCFVFYCVKNLVDSQEICIFAAGFFLFQDVKYTFQGVKYTFQGVKYTFHALK